MKNAIFFYCCFCCLLHACSYDFPQEPPVAQVDLGSADFSNFVVIGGTWSAGYMDGALYADGQNRAYPALLMEHLNKHLETTRAFVQPTVQSENGYDGIPGSAGPKGRQILEYLREGKPYLFKKSLTGEAPEDFVVNSLNNFSVPHTKLIELLDPDLKWNPFYARLNQNTSLLEAAIETKPSLILLHLGMEDILNFAAKGLTTNPNPDPNAIGVNDLTPAAVFENSIREIMEKIVNETDAPIIVVNLPDFTHFPFFRQLGHLAPISQAEAGEVDNFFDAHNELVFQYNRTVEGNRRPLINFFSDDSFTTWTLVVEDPSMPDAQLSDGTIVPKYRQLEEGELLLWSVPEFPNAEGLGLKQPASKAFYVTSEENAFLQNLIVNYNDIIAQVSSTYPEVSLLNLEEYLNSIPSSGIFIDEVLFTPDLGRTGIFSADGLNLNQRGQAWLANVLIQHLETHFSVDIPYINVNQFSGNEFRLAF